MTDLQKRLHHELSTLVAFQSVTSDTAACSRLIEYAAQKIRSCDLQVKTGQQNTHPYLVAGTRSLQQSDILLQGHIDVVPGPGDMFTVRQKDHKLLGRGVYDMLFATASYLVLLEDLHSSGQLAQLDLGVMLTSDEEIGGFDGVGHLMNDYRCNVCILPDAGAESVLCSGAKGVLQMEITLHGTSGHAARPWESDNPLLRVGGLIDMMMAYFGPPALERTVCSLTMINGGTATNQIPDTVRLRLDCRYLPTDDPTHIEKDIQLLAAKYGGVAQRLVLAPSFQLDESEPRVRSFKKTDRKHHGKPLTTTLAPGSSDARFMSAKEIPVIMTRPDGGGLHGAEEWISLPSLETFYMVLTEYVTESMEADNE